MKKIILILTLFLLMSTFFLSNLKLKAATFNFISKETIDLGYGVTVDTVKGTSKSSFNSTSSLDGRGQRIFTANISKDSEAKVVQWSYLSTRASNVWGSFTLEAISRDYEKKHPGYKVLVATNNWLSDCSQNNVGELDAVTISDGLNFRVSDKQGTESSSAFGHGYIPRPYILGFTNDGQAIYSDDFGVGDFSEKLVLSFYNGVDTPKTYLGLNIDKINEEPLDGELALYFENYTGSKTTFDNALIYQMKGETLRFDFTDNHPFVERDAFAKGKFVKLADEIKFDNKTIGAYTYYIVSKNSTFDKLDLGEKSLVCQYELLNEYKDITSATTYYFHFIRNNELYPGSFGHWNEINCEVHPRTVFFIKNDGTYALSVIDGRQGPNYTGMDYEDMANFYSQEYNAKEAFNYDGGGSSAMVIADGKGDFKVINAPSDGRERSVANATLIVVKDSGIEIKQNEKFQDKIKATITYDSDAYSKVIARVNGVEKEVINNEVEFDGLNYSTSYVVNTYYVDKDNNVVPGPALNTATSVRNAVIEKDGISVSGVTQYGCVLQVVIDDVDDAFYQTTVDIDGQKFYSRENPSVFEITGLKSLTTYNAIIYVNTQNGTSYGHDEIYEYSFTTTKARYPDDFIINITDTVLEIGSSVKLKVSYLPEGTISTCTYTTSDDQTLIVSENGVVNALNLGEATITITTKQGVSKDITFTVVLEKEVEEIKEELPTKKKCSKKNGLYIVSLINISSILLFVLRKKR